MLTSIARYLNDSVAHDLMVNWLRTVPGLPPIIQTLHIVSIAAIMASIVFIDLRILGWALPKQNLREMQNRLLPWTWLALVLLALSGFVFVIARPLRYFSNPVFGWKMALLVAAIAVSLWGLRLLNAGNQNSERQQISLSVKLLAFTSLLLWISIIFAGRWIAYADYLFPPT